MGDNDQGFHHKRNAVPKSMPASVKVGWASEPGVGLLSMSPLNASPNGVLKNVNNLSPEARAQFNHVAPAGGEARNILQRHRAANR
jgi:hypothetical protein